MKNEAPALSRRLGAVLRPPRRRRPPVVIRCEWCGDDLPAAGQPANLDSDGDGYYHYPDCIDAAEAEIEHGGAAGD